MSECERLGEDPCIERAPQFCIRRVHHASQVPLPLVRRYQERSIRSLAGESGSFFSFMCQPLLSCAAVVQAAVAIGP